MADLIKSDVFFFISSIGVVVITVGFVIVIYYFLKVLRSINNLVENINSEAKNIIKDVKELREEVGSKIKFASGFLSAVTSTAFFKNIFNKKSRSKK